MSDHKHDRKRAALSGDGIVTAVDYLASQEALKTEALETLPYDPTECSATTLGDAAVATTRQNLYACLTCQEGVCYSCSIQCHPGTDHELVELFGKRGYACGCPATRCVLKKKHRRASVSSTGSNGNNRNINTISNNNNNSSRNSTTQSAIPAVASAAVETEESKPMSGHNFRGLFCVCDEPYNPDVEDRLMVQCCFGTACDEDWFHDSCVLDWISGKPVGPATTTDATTDDLTVRALEGGNKQEVKETLSATGAVKNETHEIKREEDTVIEDDATERKHIIQESVTTAPLILPITKDELGDAAGFVCWNCVRSEQALFDLIFSAIDSNPTTGDKTTTTSNNDNGSQESKPIGRRIVQAGAPKNNYLVLFDDPCYKVRLHTLATTSSTAVPALAPYLSRFPFLFTEETTYTPPLDTSADASEDEAALLNTIPRQQAIEGLKALDGIRASLTTFLRGFAEGDRVVTEQDVTSFFENERKRKKAKH